MDFDANLYGWVLLTFMIHSSRTTLHEHAQGVTRYVFIIAKHCQTEVVEKNTTQI
jgi:hypothetical protein